MADFAEQSAEDIDTVRTMRSIVEVVRQLPTHEREVIELCAWAELSYEEAAKVLGIPIGTVRSRLSRARARIRALVETSSTPTR